MTLRVKNWHQFQHFKDRKPPWIKLYRDVLDDLIWHELSGDDAKTLVMLWLIASEMDGNLPPMKEIAFRLRVSEKSIKSTVSRLSHWLIQDDITAISDNTMISERYQDDLLETETETETETEKRQRATSAFVLPDWIPEETWEAYCKVRLGKKAKNEPHALGLIVADLEKFRAAGHDPVECLNNSIKSGWAGVFEPKRNGASQVALTVPSRPGIDPALAKILADDKRAVPMPDSLRKPRVNPLTLPNNHGID